MIALALWAVVDVLRTTVAVGHYEERITVVTHGGVDVTPAWLVYYLLDSWFRDSWFRGGWLPDTVTVVDPVWLLSLLTAAAAVTAWLYHAHGHAERLGGALAWARGWTVGGWLLPGANLVIPYLVARDVRRATGDGPPAPVGWWWASVLVTLLVHLLGWWYGMATASGASLARTALDTRTVAYPLWTTGTVAVVVTVFFTVRVVRRITAAQQRPAGTGRA